MVRIVNGTKSPDTPLPATPTRLEQSAARRVPQLRLRKDLYCVGMGR